MELLLILCVAASAATKVVDVPLDVAAQPVTPAEAVAALPAAGLALPAAAIPAAQEASAAQAAAAAQPLPQWLDGRDLDPRVRKVVDEVLAEYAREGRAPPEVQDRFREEQGAENAGLSREWARERLRGASVARYESSSKVEAGPRSNRVVAVKSRAFKGTRYFRPIDQKRPVAARRAFAAAYLNRDVMGLDTMPAAQVAFVDGVAGVLSERAKGVHGWWSFLRAPSGSARNLDARAFAFLAGDADASPFNQKITLKDGELTYFDASEAFTPGLVTTREAAALPARYTRTFVDTLRALEPADLRSRMAGLLTGPELDALLLRRDLILRDALERPQALTPARADVEAWLRRWKVDARLSGLILASLDERDRERRPWPLMLGRVGVRQRRERPALDASWAASRLAGGAAPRVESLTSKEVGQARSRVLRLTSAAFAGRRYFRPLAQPTPSVARKTYAASFLNHDLLGLGTVPRAALAVVDGEAGVLSEEAEGRGGFATAWKVSPGRAQNADALAFAFLIGDGDASFHNWRVSKDGRLTFFDASEAFSVGLVTAWEAALLPARYSRAFVERLRALDPSRLQGLLTGPELDALLFRRELLLRDAERPGARLE